MQPLCLEDLELEHQEVELYFCDEDDYPSQCVVQDTNQLKDEDIQDYLIDSLYEYPTLTIDHLSKYELCEMLEPFNVFLDNNVKMRSD